MGLPPTVWYLTALDTVDKLVPVDVQSVHDKIEDAQSYAINVRKRALRIYECRCVDVITAAVRRERK